MFSAVMASAGLVLIAISIAVAPRSAPPRGTGLLARATTETGDPIATFHGSWPVVETIDEIAARAGASAPSVSSAARRFRVEWSGFFHSDGGRYAFVVGSDDDSELEIDGRIVLSNPDEHPRRVRTGEIELAPGNHPLTLRYGQRGGAYALDAWVAPPGEPLASWQSHAWRFSETAQVQGLGRASQALSPTLVLGLGVTGVWLLIAAAGATVVVYARRRLGVSDGRLELAGLALAVLIAIPGFAWGLPIFYMGWAMDELTPVRIGAALDAGFRNGWGDLYPPLAFYLAAPGAWVVNAIGARWGWSAQDGTIDLSLQVYLRGLVLLTSAAALAGVHALGRQFLSREAALWATAAAWCSATVFYHARVANVDLPYVALLIWSAAFVAAYLRSGRRGDLYWAAGLAAASVGTKDQAAGFFVLLPVVLVAIGLWSADSIVAVMTDRRWPIALAVVAVVLAAVYLVPLNSSGLVEHLRLVEAGRYRPQYSATPDEYVLFTIELARLMSFVATPPMLLLVLAGWVAAVARKQWIPVIVVATLVGSYYLTFLLSIRYAYDRFLIGVWFLLALGVGFLIEAARSRRLTGLAVRAVCAVALALAAHRALQVARQQSSDSRLAIEAFLNTSTPVDSVISLLGPAQYFPRVNRPLARFVDALEWKSPDAPSIIVVNEDYARRFFRRSDLQEVVKALRAGTTPYREVLRCGPRRLADLGAMDEFRAFGARSLTNLDKISPIVAVYSRIDLPAPDGGARCEN